MVNEMIDDKQARLVAAYGAHIIHKYLEEICAAAYPQTPEQHGGYAYEYFKAHYENIQKLLEGKSLEEIKTERLAAVRNVIPFKS